MAKDFDADRYITKRWTVNETNVRYVRSATGSDANDGLTPATAWATLEKGLTSFAIAAVNESWVLDIAGTFSGSETLNIGGTQLGGLNNNLDLAATGPDNFLAYSHGQIRAALSEVIAPITISGSSAQATTGLYTINVTNVLVAGAHVGQILAAEGLVEYARITANGVGTITVSTTTDPSTWTGTVGIYEEGATITYSDAVSYNQSVQLIALMDWFFTGINFEVPDPALVSMSCIANAPIYFQLCKFNGIYLSGPETTTFDACDINAFYTHDGAGVLTRNSTFRDVEFLCHGASASGTNDWTQCVFLDGVSPFGAGNVESVFYFNLTNCFFDGFATDTIHALFGNSRMTDCLITNTAGDAIETNGPNVRLDLNNVDGSTGNTGVGIRILNGSQVDVDAATSVTGAGGDISLGDAGVIAYAAVPAVDLGQLVRIY